MKKVIKGIFILLIIIPIYAKALSFTTFDNSISNTNNYVNRFKDSSKYLIFFKGGYYDLHNGKPTSNPNFSSGGLLSREEFNTSLYNGISYLSNGREYWTLTTNGSSFVYYVDADINTKNKNERSGIRVTEYVKPSVRVDGKGTYVSPWVFRNEYNVDVKSNSTTYGTVSPASQMVKPGGTSQEIVIKENRGYMYSANDCGLEKFRTINTYESGYKLYNVKKDYSCVVYFDVRKIKVSYNCNGGQGSTSGQTITFNKNYKLNASGCTRTGFVQTGWVSENGGFNYSLNQEGTWNYDNGEHGVTNNELKLKAVWKDTIKPKLKITAYNYDSTKANNVGSKVLHATEEFSADGTITIDENWINEEVVLKLESSDAESGIKTTVWKYNASGSTNDTGNTYTSGSPKTINAASSTSYESFTARGYRKGQLVVTDKDNNVLTVTVIVKLANSRIDLKPNSGSLSGSTVVYAKNGTNSLYTSRFNTTAATLPTATKTGYDFIGWYTSANGGSMIIAPNGTVQSNKTNWTDSSGKFTLTNGSDTSDTYALYARFEDSSIPTASIETTSNLKVATQTATLKCSDTAGVTSYYWGKELPLVTSTYTNITSTTSMTVEKPVNEAGTYFLVCKDAAGNTSIAASKEYFTYLIHNRLLTTSGTSKSYTETDYELAKVDGPYLAPKDTTIPITSVYTIPEGSNSARYEGANVGIADSTSATISKTDPKLTANSVINAWFSRNVVYFKYQLQSGETLKSPTVQSGNTYDWSTNSNSYITRSKNGATATDNMTNYRYGLTKMNLLDYNNSTALYITKSGFAAVSGAEWICVSGCKTANQTFSHSEATVDFTSVCSNIKTSDCTVVVKVNWSANNYLVKFDCNGGSGAPANQTATYGQSFTLTSSVCSTPKSGYAQAAKDEWNTAADGTGTNWNTNNTKNWKWNLTNDVTLYAKWKSNQYTITYNANGGSGAPSATTYTYATSGTVDLDSTKPTKDGYAFLGWSTSSTGTAYQYAAGGAFPKNIAGNTTLYAVWVRWSNNESTVEYYNSLADAVSGTAKDKTIKLLASYSDDTTVSIDKSLTINLDNKTLTRDKTITVASGGNVTISGTGTLTTTANIPITNSGTLTVSGGTITSSADVNIISNSGTLTVSGGTIKQDKKYSGVLNTGTMSVTGGTLESNSGTLDIAAVENKSTFTMSGGEIKAKSESIGLWQPPSASSATSTITGGTLESEINNAIWNQAGTVNANGGTMTSGGTNHFTVTSNGTLNIGGATIITTSGYGAVYINGNDSTMTSGKVVTTASYNYNEIKRTLAVAKGTFTMSGGTIGANSSSVYGGNCVTLFWDTMDQDEDPKFVMNGGELITYSDGTNAGRNVTITNGTFEFNGGTITMNQKSGTTNNKKCHVWKRYNNVVFKNNTSTTFTIVEGANN